MKWVLVGGIKVGSGLSIDSNGVLSVSGGGTGSGNGKSAYELAVENGFTGTVEQWLASLVGAKGDKGEQGIQGTKGDTGADGANGYTPIKGVDYWTDTDKDQITASLQPMFNSKANATHTHAQSDITGLSTAITNMTEIAQGKCASYVFDNIASLAAWLTVSANTSALKIGDIFLIRAVDVPDYWWDGSAIQKLETTKVDLTDYVTTSTYNQGLSDKANASHTHDDRYYTETEVNTMLGNKSDTGHTHTSIIDYADATNQIQIGYKGAGLTTGNTLYIAGYTDGGHKIKDVSFEVLASLLNNTSKANANALAKKSEIPTSLPANGGNADTVDSKHIWTGTTAQLPSTRDSNTIYIVTG